MNTFICFISLFIPSQRKYCFGYKYTTYCANSWKMNYKIQVISYHLEKELING